MGGGGGSDSGSLGDTRALQQRAREILERSQASRKNVFISFAFEDLNEVNLLRGQAKNENSNLEFNDRSIKEPFNSERAEYIRQKLTERINQCSTTIIYLSGNTPGSEWVDWEVRKSIELGKNVIATHKGDAPPALLPSAVNDNRIEVVPWADLSRNLSKFK